MRFCMSNIYPRFIKNTTLSLGVSKVLHRDLIATFPNFPLPLHRPRPGSLLLATLAAATSRLCRRLLCWASRPAHAAAPAPCPRLQTLGFAPRPSSGTEKREEIKWEGEKREHIHVREIRSFLRVSERPKTVAAKISASGFAAPCGSLF